MFLEFLYSLLTSFIFWYWYIRPHSDEPRILPGCLPFVGHGHLLVGSTINLWNQVKYICYKTMEIGHASILYTGFYKIYVLTDPDDIHKLSNTCFQKDRFSHEFTKELLGDGLLFSEASTWKRHRKLINPSFNQQILDGFITIFNEQGHRLLKRLEAEVRKGPFDHSHYVRPIFMETICLTILNINLSEEEAVNYVKAFEDYLMCNISRFQKFWLHSDFLFKFSNLKKEKSKCVKYLNDTSDYILRRKRAERELFKSNDADKQTNPKLKIFMELMLDLDGETLSDREIRDEINTLLMAGHDTSANVTVFTLILIGSFPDVQERIYKELREVLKDRDVEKQDLAKLVYLEAVLKETMRYYVMAPFVLRYVDREVKLKNFTLKPGYNCLMMLYGVHRNPLWGPDAEEFKPERWLNPETMLTNPNIFAGFSVGKRNCIGKSYAMMSMKVLLSHLLRRYKLHADHTEVVLKVDILLKPVSGHFISIEDRLKV